MLTLSSAALMSASIAITAYTYDRTMRRFSWRWSLFWAVIIGFFVGLFSMSNSPLGWIFTHLTLDPQTGYYRLLIWEAALAQIDQAPYTGVAFNLFNNEILDNTVDSVWLVLALRFGIPAIILLCLTNVAALWPVRRTKERLSDPHLSRMRPAFTMVLVMFMFIGLTVHFWNYMWIFWGLCIGIRASIRERSVAFREQSHSNTPQSQTHFISTAQ
jgi:hypothetical protein